VFWIGSAITWGITQNLARSTPMMRGQAGERGGGIRLEQSFMPASGVDGHATEAAAQAIGSLRVPYPVEAKAKA
jgi:hypothetical protein